MHLVGGRLCTRCTISIEEEQIVAQLMINLGGTYGVVLDQEGCGSFEFSPSSLVTLDFPSNCTLSQLPYRQGDLSSFRDFTTEYASELEEIPVWGAMGLGTFGESNILLDIQAGTLTFGMMEPPDDNWMKLSYDDSSGQYRLPIEPMDDYTLRAGFTTLSYETRIDAVCAMLADYPGGNFETCMLGALNLSEVTAIRPTEGLSDQLTECEAMVGNSVWQNFVMQIDPINKSIWLSRKDDLWSDLNEQDYYMALVDQDMEAIERYIQQYPQSRLAHEAATTILTHRIQDASLTSEQIEVTLDYLCQVVSAKRAAQDLLTLSDSLPENSPHMGLLLDRANICAQQTNDAALIGRDIQVRRGRNALERGDLEQAHLHLLSALFGQPGNGTYNYWMGRYYEAAGQPLRAWSRYLKACLASQPVDEAIGALELLTNDSNLRQEFTIQDAQDFLEGYIYAYSPAGFTERWQRPDNTLVEAFMCADNTATAGINLVLRALADEGVAVATYPIHSPDFDPMANPASVIAAENAAIESTPTVLINGTPVSLAEEDMTLPDNILKTLAEAEVAINPMRIDVGVQTDNKGHYQITTSWPSDLQGVDHADVYWVESKVLLNSANQCWLHGPVVRGACPNADQQLTDGKLTCVLDPVAVKAAHEAYAHQTETEQSISYRSIPSYIEVNASSILVKLYNRDGALIAFGTQTL